MNSSKPYLIRALHEWIVDNDCTPYVLVAVDMPGVQVPEGYGENGQLVLNVSPSAVRHLQMGNEGLSFEARFGGVARQIVIPLYAIMAIYAQENGQGMFFDAEQQEEAGHAALEEPPVAEEAGVIAEEQDAPSPSPSGKPSLRIVK